MKDLEQLWEQHPAFDAATTILVDDSELKASLQPQNLLLLPSFDEAPPLGPDGADRQESRSDLIRDSEEVHCDGNDDVLLGLSEYLRQLQVAMTAFQSAKDSSKLPDTCARTHLTCDSFGRASVCDVACRMAAAAAAAVAGARTREPIPVSE